MRGEIVLFRHEMSENIRRLVVGLVVMVGAAVFAIVGLLVLIDALVKWLATVVGSEALSALIIGMSLLAVAVVLALLGRGRLSLTALAPPRTGRQLQQAAKVIKEHVEA